MPPEDGRKESQNCFRNAITTAASLFSLFSLALLEKKITSGDKPSNAIERKYSGFSFSAIFSVLVAVLTINNVVFAFLSSNILGEQMASIAGIALFVVTIGTSLVIGHYLLLKLVSYTTMRLRGRDKNVDLLYKMLKVSQYVLAIMLVVLLLQVLFALQFYSFLLIGVLAVTFGIASVVTAFLGYKIFSWYKSNKSDGKGKNFGTLLVALTVTTLCIGTTLTTLVNTGILLQESPTTIDPKHQIRENDLSLSGQGAGLFKTLQANNYDDLTLMRNTFLPFRVSFVLVWISSSYLLRGYMKSLGRLKFWTIVTLPLASYLIAFLHSSSLPSFTVEDRIVLVASAIAGGILISFSFLAVSRSVSKSIGRSKNDIVEYMRMSAYGTILLLVSLSSPVLFVFFPPFGIASWSLVGLSAFLFTIGIYSSAISLSEDTKLRASIKKNAMDDSRLLHDFGTAQMKRRLRKEY